MNTNKLNNKNVVIVCIIVTSICLGVTLGVQCRSTNINQSVNIGRPANTDDKININTASIKQLKLLPGIGDKKAEKIISHRPYNAISDLVDIIGKKTFKNINNKVVVE